MTTSNPIDLAAEIVASFVAHNSLPRGELPALIETVHAAVKRLADGGKVAPAAIDPPASAVSIRKSVTPDYLICLEDGKQFKSLRRHLATLGMTPEQYRAKWNLPSTYPMVAPNYTAQRSALAKNIGFGLRENPIAAPRASAAGTIEVATVERTGGCQGQSQGQEQGGRGRAGGPGKTQTRSPAQGDGVANSGTRRRSAKANSCGSVMLWYCESQREMERTRHRMKALARHDRKHDVDLGWAVSTCPLSYIFQTVCENPRVFAPSGIRQCGISERLKLSRTAVASQIKIYAEVAHVVDCRPFDFSLIISAPFVSNGPCMNRSNRNDQNNERSARSKGLLLHLRLAMRHHQHGDR